MVNQIILEHFLTEKIINISPSQLEDLLKKSKTIEEKDTLISGQIRILKYDNQILVQESTPKNEILIHKLENQEDAKKFVEERLEIYDKMWDGCGCKIDYFK